MFFLCRDTETVNAVGIISIHLEYWNNQTTLLRYSTYLQPDLMWHWARFHTDIVHLYVQMDRLSMCSYRMFGRTSNPLLYQKYSQTGFQGLMLIYCNQKRCRRTYNLLVRRIYPQIIPRGLMSNLCNQKRCC